MIEHQVETSPAGDLQDASDRILPAPIDCVMCALRQGESAFFGRARDRDHLASGGAANLNDGDANPSSRTVDIDGAATPRIGRVVQHRPRHLKIWNRDRWLEIDIVRQRNQLVERASYIFGVAFTAEFPYLDALSCRDARHTEA